MGNRFSTQQIPGPMPQNDRPDPAAMFNKADRDGSGGLDQAEFQTLAAKISEATGQQVDVDELFATYDADGDGLLGKEETQTAMDANPPEGPPSQEEMAIVSGGSGTTVSFGIERYLQIARLGMEQQRSNDLFSISSDSGNGYSGERFNSVNTWS
jgi:Ca2+-binding EF-hand superfamily protein